MRGLIAGFVAVLIILAGVVTTTSSASAATKKVYKSWSVAIKKSHCRDEWGDRIPKRRCGPVMVVKSRGSDRVSEDDSMVVRVYNSKGKRAAKAKVEFKIKWRGKLTKAYASTLKSKVG